MIEWWHVGWVFACTLLAYLYGVWVGLREVKRRVGEAYDRGRADTLAVVTV